MFSRIEGDKAKNSDKINEQQLEEMDLTSITSDHRTVQLFRLIFTTYKKNHERILHLGTTVKRREKSSDRIKQKLEKTNLTSLPSSRTAVFT